jgi:6-phosphogluconolactonase
MMKRRFMAEVLVVGLVLGGTGAALAAEQGRAGPKPDKLRVYVGTYTRGSSKGIYLCQLDLATGKLQAAEVAGAAVNPSFLAIHPGGSWLYAVGEVDQFAGQKSGAVSAFSLDPQTGRLTLLNQQSSRGAGPCHLVVDRSGRHVLVANYGSGSIACLPIQEKGGLGEATSFVQHQGSGPNRQRQQGPHAHSINLDAANRFAFVADLGLDKIMVYRFDATEGKLTANDPPSTATAPGAGPRHFALHPGGRYAYVINELDSTMTALAYDAQRGVLKPLQTLSTLPDGFKEANFPAEVQVHPSGKVLYGSNRGHNSIAAYAIDQDTGRLRFLGAEPTQGKNPRNFAIDPTGAYLLAANQDSDNLVVLRIDAATGKLQATGNSLSVPSPVCVKFMPPLLEKVSGN